MNNLHAENSAEQWLDAVGYAGKYQVSDMGRVRRIYAVSRKTRLMAPYRRHGKPPLFVKLSSGDGAKEVLLHRLVAAAFLGAPPCGCVAYHKNGLHSDNSVTNISYIQPEKLGKLTGAMSRRRGVAKIDSGGEIAEFYSSARSCAKANYMSYQTVIDRCNGQCKKAFAPDGFEYAWEDSAASLAKAYARIEKYRAPPKAFTEMVV